MYKRAIDLCLGDIINYTGEDFKIVRLSLVGDSVHVYRTEEGKDCLCFGRWSRVEMFDFYTEIYKESFHE